MQKITIGSTVDTTLGDRGEVIDRGDHRGMWLVDINSETQKWHETDLGLVSMPSAKFDALPIAQRWFGVETLETQNSDRLDFHEVGVFSMEQALKAAFDAGVAAANAGEA